MPRYDFKCIECDSIVEIVMIDGDDPFPKCQKCNVTMSKVFTPPAIHFKGGGWGGSK
jgi:putative FmdB family regulatory protein